jgi:hypothetical protein
MGTGRSALAEVSLAEVSLAEVSLVEVSLAFLASSHKSTCLLAQKYTY